MGVQASSEKSITTIGSSATEYVDISADTRSGGIGIWNTAGSTLTVLGSKKIDISGTQNAVLNKSGTLTLGSEATENVTLTSSETSGSATLETNTGGTTTVLANTVEVHGADAGIVSIEGKINIEAADTLRVVTPGGSGIHVQGNDEAQENPDRATINIEAGHTIVEAVDGAALLATSNGELNIKGDLTATAETAIEARGNATVNINQQGTDTVVLTGDIVFATPGPEEDSGTELNAEVNLNLTGAASSWTGNTAKLAPTSVEPEKQTITGFNMTLADGAVWKATNIDLTVPDGANATAAQEKVTNLTLSGGTITLADVKASAKIGTISGTGGTINSAVAKENGILSAAQVSIDAVDESAAPVLAVKYTGITADDLTEENVVSLNALTGEAIEGDTSNVQKVETVQEGNLKGEWTRGPGDDVGGSYGENTKLSSYSSITAMSLVQWRNEINHLTKRLGDIRTSESAVGAWARVYGGASEWGSNPEVDMDHTTIQVGGDYRINPNWIVGSAFSYTDSDAESSDGFADGESYSLAAYATYLADNGSFLDMIARYGYLKNDITAGNMALETKNNAFSLSVEGGHQFRFIEDRAYIEPQIKLTYGFVSGDDADASNGVRIEQDDYQNLITRVGVRTGFDFPEKAGTIYATLSYSYDFLGDADGTASGQTEAGYESVALTEGLGGGWVTYGIGAQFRLGDNAFAYGELERTSGGDIDNPYLFNVGFRYNF